MTARGFACCCTASEVGYFNGTELEELKEEPGEGIMIATQGTWQPHSKMLLEAGFKDVGTYHGHGGTVHLFVKGLTLNVPEGKGVTKRIKKSLTKPRARSKRAAK